MHPLYQGGAARFRLRIGKERYSRAEPNPVIQHTEIHGSAKANTAKSWTGTRFLGNRSLSKPLIHKKSRGIRMDTSCFSGHMTAGGSAKARRNDGFTAVLPWGFSDHISRAGSQHSASARFTIFCQVASTTGTPSASACACFWGMSRPGIWIGVPEPSGSLAR